MSRGLNGLTISWDNLVSREKRDRNTSRGDMNDLQRLKRSSRTAEWIDTPLRLWFAFTFLGSKNGVNGKRRLLVDFPC